MSDVPAETPGGSGPTPEGPHDLSLMLGGPFFQLMLRAGLIRPTFDLLLRRVVLLTAVAWLPLFLLTLAAGSALGGSVHVPFLWDLDVHARLLVMLPLLVLAERVIHERLRPLLAQFVDRGLVAPQDGASFDAALRRARRWRDSYVAEALMIVVSVVATPLLWQHEIVLDAPTWYGRSGAAGMDLTAAGYWYAYFVLPLVRFLILRWVYRLLLLCALLGRISRLSLQIVPTHPDGAGGLLFLDALTSILQPLFTAVAAMVSGFIAGKVLHEGRALPEYYVLIGAVLGAFLVVTVLPLLFFTPPLVAARRRGLLQYGALAQTYVRDFHRKWVEAKGHPGEALLGSADVQSLADLSTAFDLVRSMRTVPMGLRSTVETLVESALPLAPLLLTLFPLETLLQQALEFVL